MAEKTKRVRIRAKKPRAEKICAICGDAFGSNHAKAKYCSDNCYAIGQKPLHVAAFRKRSGIPVEGVRRNCVVCSSTFTVNNSNQRRCQPCIDEPATHAPECKCGCGQKTAWQPTIGYATYVPGHSGRTPGYGKTRFVEKPCATCGGLYLPRSDDSKNCSRFCYAKSRKGMNHERFKGGRSKYRFSRNSETKVFHRTHRVAMEEKIERKLKWHEIVHHIEDENGGRSEDISRLFLFHCDRCHHHHHMTGKALRYRYVPAHMKNGVPVGLPKRKPNQIGK